MKKIIVTLGLLFMAGCSVNASKLDDNYVRDFANNVRCAEGYKGACFCFVASRMTGDTFSSGMGMTIDHTGKLCE